MELYMWDLIGGYADNDTDEIQKHAGEISRICDRILDGCIDAFIRTDAVVMRGKLLHAAGRTAEALALYQKELPDWYQTSGQKCEQLFDKDTEEFRNRLEENIYEEPGNRYHTLLCSSCTARFFALAGNAEAEAATYLNRLPEGVSLLGMYGNGEYCPIKGVKSGETYNFFHNFTFTIMAI